MTHAGELMAAYSITFGAIGAYAAWLAAKRRAIRRGVSGQGADALGRPGITPGR